MAAKQPFSLVGQGSNNGTVPNTSLHGSLSNSSDQIRLLQILPASKNDPVTVCINAFDRESAPPYAAVSYTWGDSQLSKQILANGDILNITETCWYALGQLRLYGVYEYYWVDALCIDQSDDAEKSAQVNRMGDTFRDAQAVSVSLGRHTRESTTLYKFIAAHQNAPEDRIEDLFLAMNDRTFDEWFRAVRAYGSISYWSRLWVVQEFGLPRTIVTLCGKDSLNWSLLRLFFDKSRNVLQKNHKEYSVRLSAPYERTLHDLPMSELDRFRTAIQNSPSGLLHFTDLFLQLRARGCHDPRDRVYGLLSLIGNPERATLKADYSIPPIQLALLTLSCVDQVYVAPIASHLVMVLELEANDPRMRELAIKHAQQLPASQHALWPTEDAPIATFRRASKIYRIRAKTKRVNVSDSWDLLVLDEYDTDILVPNFARRDDIILRFHDNFVDATSEDITNMSTDEAAFVLRQHGNERYEIVGHAYLAWDKEDALACPTYVDPQDMLLKAWHLQQGHVLEVLDSTFPEMEDVESRGRGDLDSISFENFAGMMAK